MRLQLNSVAGALVLVTSASVAAQSQPAAQTAPTVAPQSPAKTKTTTTQSTSSTAVVPDEAGGVAAQKTTDTTQTTTTQPANGTPQSATSQTSTTIVKPDEPGAATTTTTTTQPATDQTGATVTTATSADVKAGVPVFDQKGGVVGKIDSVSAKGAVVSTGKVKALVPVSSLGKNDKGLVISMTKTELEAASGKSAPQPKTAKKPK
jgi:hypothetical protein